MTCSLCRRRAAEVGTLIGELCRRCAVMITLEAVATNPELARGVTRDVLIRAMIACALALMGETQPSVAMERAFSPTLTMEEATRLRRRSLD